MTTPETITGVTEANSAEFRPIGAYNRALIDVAHSMCDSIRAIRDNDVELFYISANDAVGAWIAADAVYRRLSREIGQSEQLEAIRLGLSQRSEDLQELLTTAESKFTSQTLQEMIRYMRESLAIAQR